MVLLAHEYKPEAAACFAHAAEINPNDDRWHYLRGNAVVSTDPDVAIESIATAVNVSGDRHPYYRLVLVDILLEQGRLAEADSQLQTYLHLGQQPDRARARHAKARLLFMQGRFRECHDEITSFLRDTAQEYNKAIAKANELAKSDKQAASALVRS
ncbi:MAG: hypothetical protein KDA51_13200, partial [Planctomycetales bacterium]|nr:hypothetical protein [Planctomycetales bacterium]